MGDKVSTRSHSFPDIERCGGAIWIQLGILVNRALLFNRGEGVAGIPLAQLEAFIQSGLSGHCSTAYTHPYVACVRSETAFSRHSEQKGGNRPAPMCEEDVRP